MSAHRWTARPLALAGLLLAACLGGAARAAAPATAPVAPPAFPAPPAAPLTVDAAVAFALQHNPAVTLGEENVQIAREQVRAAQAVAQPSIGVSGTANYIPGATPIVFQGNTIGGNKLNASAQATASRPIWPPDVWRAPVAGARAGVGVNQQALLRTQQQVAFQTRQAFFQLLNAQELLTVAQYAVRVAEEQLRLAKATFAAGTTPRLDVLQAESTVEDARVNQARAENTVDVSRAALATQLGLPAGAPIAITPPEGLPVAPAEVDPLVAAACAARPELQQLTFRRQQVLAGMATIRLQQAPVVNLQGSYAKTLAGGSLFGTDGLSFTAVASWNLFNGGATKANLAAARVQLEQLNTTAQQIELGVSLDVRQAWLNLQNALKQYQAAAKQSAAADEALRIAELRYREGEGIQLEVEQAMLRSTQARTSLTQARFQAQVAAAQLQFAVGAPPAAQLPTAPAPPIPPPPAVAPAAG